MSTTMLKEKHENATVIPSKNGSIEMTMPSPPKDSTTAPTKSNNNSDSRHRNLRMFRLFRRKAEKQTRPPTTNDDGQAVVVTPKVRRVKDDWHHKPLSPIVVPQLCPTASSLHSLQEEIDLTTSSSSDFPTFYRSQSSRSIDSVQPDDYSSYFLKTDFIKDTWMETITSQTTESLSLGFISIMAATVVIHPIIFVTGAATAVWAVGVVHALDKGYDFFSDGQFKNMFWADRDDRDAEQVLLLDDGVASGCDVVAEGKAEERTDVEEKDDTTNVHLQPIEFTSQYSSFRTNKGDNCLGELSDSERDLYLPQIPPSPLHSPGPKSLKQHVKPVDEAILDHFPQLENELVKAEFPGLNALEFFHVFLSDDAPYSYKEFQQTRGDVDVDFGKWKRWNESEDIPISFHPNSHLGFGDGKHKLPSSSKKERELTFKTLTKSYFGPAYASAKKVQRVSKFSTRLVIVESKTDLFDIPYSDRFFVVERWIIEAIKHDGDVLDLNKSMMYTTKLSVSVEVFMLKSCPWEKQIRSKTLSTFTELMTSWTHNATQALDLTIQRKLERMRTMASFDGDRSLVSYRSKDSRMTYKDGLNDSTAMISTPGKSEQALMSMHQKQLKMLQEKIAAGDLEWCSIEMKHSIEAGTGRSTTKILNGDINVSSSDSTGMSTAKILNGDTEVSNSSEESDVTGDCPKIISVRNKSKPRRLVLRIINKKKK